MKDGMWVRKPFYLRGSQRGFNISLIPRILTFTGWGQAFTLGRRYDVSVTMTKYGLYD